MSKHKCVYCNATCDSYPCGCQMANSLVSIPVTEEQPRIQVTLAGKKFDTDKVDVGLLSSIAVIEIARVMTFGKRKYDAHNWRKGIQYSRLLSAALRHIFAYLGGESIDLESGISHLAHACCCLMMILEFEVTKPELDDRWRNS